VKAAVALRIEAANDTIVHGDRDLLFEAIANLVNNAIKFTPEDERVELVVFREGNEAIVRVKDTGPGISRERTQCSDQAFLSRKYMQPHRGAGLRDGDRQIA
jgi:signal transduction histidine kinase